MVDESLHDVQVGTLEAELSKQRRPEVLRHRGVDLQADGFRRALSDPQQRLQRLEQIVGFVDFDLDVGVPCHPERVPTDDLHTGEQSIEVCGDELLERDEPARAWDLDEAGQQGRDLYAREALERGDRVPHDHGEVQ